MSAPKYPDVEVTLTGTDGNAFSIIGKVAKALRRASVPPAIVSEFTKEATSGDYDHVLATAFAWVDVS